MSTFIAVVAALAAACAFGIAVTVQHDVASTDSSAAAPQPALLMRLARRPRWLVAVAVQAASYGVQAIALAYGPIALVAPLSATDLLFALPLMARRLDQRLGTREWLGAGGIAGGVGVFLAASPPTTGISEPAAGRWLVVLAAAGAGVGAAVRLGWRRPGKLRAALLAAAAALTFAVVAALTKSFVALLAADRFAALASWIPYALLVAGVTGAFLLQSAFQAGPLSVSLPLIDTIEPVGSVLIGATVFDEHLAATPLRLAVQLMGAAVAVAGVIAVDSSPLAAPPERTASSG